MTNNIQSGENHEKPSSQGSRRTKTSQRSAKVQPMDPLVIGSEDTRSLSTSEPEKKRSLKSSGDAMPVPKLTAKQDRVLQALKRLGVSREDVESAPQITPSLKMADGGLKAVLNAMRFSSDDPDISQFLEKYDAIPAGDRERLPWEAIAISADLNVKHLLGAIHIALDSHSVSTVKIIARTSHPKIMQATVKYALMASGEKDRTTAHTILGALPSPKGPTFIQKAIFGGAPQTANDKDDDGPKEGVFVDDGDLDGLFPPSNAMQEKLVPIRQKLLE
jgi:hypothetical protein